MERVIGKGERSCREAERPRERLGEQNVELYVG